ncbi:MAG: VTT domain-containing protein [Candidatus Gastranaerophilales bacterium]|nr:VTT domain-containing protein [Candidatus Gastranaerophilales bacterium]
MQKHKYILLFLLIFAILLLYLMFSKYGIDNFNEISFFSKFGYLTPFIFVAIYGILPVFFVPITPLSIYAGILFGPFLGILYTLLGQLIAASMTFLVSRYILKDWVDRKSPARVAIFQEKIKKYGWEFVFISRLTPIFPFNVQNYLFGVTNISYKTFILASIFSLMPGAIAFVYIGYAGKSLYSGDSDSIYKIIIAFSLFIIIGFLPKLIKRKAKD